MHTYQFTSSVEDLLEAEEAERSTFIRAPFRWAIVALGLVWLVAGLIASVRQPAWLPLVWTCLGLGVLYHFVVRPWLRRNRIRSSNAARQDVTLEVADDRMRLGISGVGELTRRWDELAGITDTDRGILFYFSDGVKNRLPNRVFASGVQKRKFLEFVNDRQMRRPDELG